jgi:signal transduction histidine kinase
MQKVLNLISNRLRNRPISTIFSTILLTFLLFFPLGLNAWTAYQQFNRVIVSDLHLQKLMGTIVYLDEVLTMSAQMNAATGETSWEQRYKKVEPQLDAAIKESIHLAPDAYDASITSITDVANLKLVEMESQSFDWVRQGKREKAVALLRGPAYAAQKRIYAEGTEKTTIAINQRIQNNQSQFSQNLLFSILVSIGSLLILLPIWTLILRLLNQYLSDVRSARYSLQLLNEELESRVESRTAELTKTLHDLQQMQLSVVQVEKMSGLGNLVAGVAHEINNPIGFLNGSVSHAKTYISDLLAHLDVYEQNTEKLAIIQDHADEIELDFIRSDLPKLLTSMSGAIDRIKNISTSLRNFSRADTEHLVKANLQEGIESTILILSYRLKANEFRPAIKIEFNPGDIPEISCFPGQLNQVFMNLLANAIDMFDEMAQAQSFSTIQPQQITIEFHLIDQQIEISIRDNGIGMSEEVKAKIFDHLFTTKVVGKGTGLGLAIARQIVVEKHRGNLTVDSIVGQGTVFTIRLPI